MIKRSITTINKSFIRNFSSISNEIKLTNDQINNISNDETQKNIILTNNQINKIVGEYEKPFHLQNNINLSQQQIENILLNKTDRIDLLQDQIDEIIRQHYMFKQPEFIKNIRDLKKYEMLKQINEKLEYILEEKNKREKTKK